MLSLAVFYFKNNYLPTPPFRSSVSAPLDAASLTYQVHESLDFFPLVFLKSWATRYSPAEFGRILGGPGT